MNDPADLESRWAAMSKCVKYDKMHLETNREIITDQKNLDAGKKFSPSEGLKVLSVLTYECIGLLAPMEYVMNPEDWELKDRQK